MHCAVKLFSSAIIRKEQWCIPLQSSWCAIIFFSLMCVFGAFALTMNYVLILFVFLLREFSSACKILISSILFWILLNSLEFVLCGAILLVFICSAFSSPVIKHFNQSFSAYNILLHKVLYLQPFLAWKRYIQSQHFFLEKDKLCEDGRLYLPHTSFWTLRQEFAVTKLKVYAFYSS